VGFLALSAMIPQDLILRSQGVKSQALVASKQIEDSDSNFLKKRCVKEYILQVQLDKKIDTFPERVQVSQSDWEKIKPGDKIDVALKISDGNVGRVVPTSLGLRGWDTLLGYFAVGNCFFK
jgi:hypothetical protein